MLELYLTVIRSIPPTWYLTLPTSFHPLLQILCFAKYNLQQKIDILPNHSFSVHLISIDPEPSMLVVDVKEFY